MEKFENLKSQYPCPTCKSGRLNLKIVSNGEKALYQCDHFVKKENGVDKCDQVIWINQFNVQLNENQMNDLIEKGKTELINFNNKGKKFSGKVIISNNSTQIEFNDVEELFEGVKCPACDSEIYESERGYYCEGVKDDSCHIYVPKVIAQHKVTNNEAMTLLKGNSTEFINDFVSKNDKKFSAKLYINEDTFKVAFDNTICECNCEKGGIIKDYQKVYKCSMNVDENDDCNFLIFKTIAGKKISKKIVEELLENGKTSEKLEFQNKKGESFNAYLELTDDLKTNFAY